MDGAEPGGWRRLSLPLRVGIVFAAIGLMLAFIGIFRGNVPLNLQSVFLALLISGGSWGLVSWAVASAVVDVETDVTTYSEEPREPDSA